MQSEYAVDIITEDAVKFVLVEKRQPVYSILERQRKQCHNVDIVIS